MAQNSTLSTRQARAIEALLSSASITEAAERSGIGRRTLHTWLDDSDFRASLASAESDAIGAAVRRLCGDMAGNLATMREIRDDPDQSAALRLRAAIALDASLQKWRDLATTEERLTALEARLMQ
jgi:hypothetical protein